MAVVEQEVVSEIRDGERVLLFPSFGHRSADGKSWKIAINGVIFELTPEKMRQRIMLTILRRFMRIDRETVEAPLFQERVKHFLISTDRGRRIGIRIGESEHPIQRPTKRNGHFRGWYLMDSSEETSLNLQGDIQDEWLRYRLSSPDDGDRVFDGEAQLIDNHGTSVISDIDDTIKFTDVGNRQELLRNTFMRKFQPIEGMSPIFDAWKQQGVAFHYVSSSPWQLYPALSEWMISCGFPKGSFHLRNIRLKDQNIPRLFWSRRNSKRRLIRTLIRMFPLRKFVLVGDSGEKDPEIYAAMAKRFPNQIERILIRRVPNCRKDAKNGEKAERAFRQVDGKLWQIFSDPEEISHLRLVN